MQMHKLGWPACAQAGAAISRSFGSIEREETSVRIDRSGFILPKEHSHREQPSTELARQIEVLIKVHLFLKLQNSIGANRDGTVEY